MAAPWRVLPRLVRAQVGVGPRNFGRDAPGSLGQEAWQGYTAAEDAVRRNDLELYRELGRAPPREEIARRSGMARERVRTLLDRLARRDLVVLEGDQTWAPIL